MYYYIYQITNLVNNKIYVGVHKTKNLNDGYMGSGRIIRSAIQKYGVSNFSKVILEFFENAELMYAKEKEIVTEEFLARDDVYNLRRGGTGGFDYINKRVTSEEKAKFGQRGGLATAISPNRVCKFAPGTQSSGGKKTQELHREKIRNALNSESARARRTETFYEIGHQQGSKNSQFGTCWISHELHGSKKCKKDELALYISQGWIKGRIQV